jgi:hypothetical protein
MMNKTQNQSNNSRYKEFNDVSRYSKGDRDWTAQYEYTGDGQQQIDFFKKYSNAYDLIDNMTPKEKESFLRWAEGEFMHGESWRNWEDMPSRHRECTKDFDKILDKATMKRGVTVVRDTTAELLFGAGHKTGTLADLKLWKVKLFLPKGLCQQVLLKLG